MGISGDLGKPRAKLGRRGGDGGSSITLIMEVEREGGYTLALTQTHATVTILMLTMIPAAIY